MAAEAGAVTLGGAPAVCGPPVAPTAVARTYPDQEQLPELRGDDVLVPAIPRSASLVAGPDSDGDGTPDEVVPRSFVTDPVALRRSDGVVVLSTSEPGRAVFGVGSAGDVDGDGRDEVTVFVGGEDPDDAGATSTWIVTGPLVPGPVDVSTVGVRLEAGQLVPPGAVEGFPPGLLLVVGDQPAYPTADSALDPTTSVVRAADFARALPGGGIVPTVVRLPGLLVGWIEDPDGLTLVTGALAARGVGGVVRVGDVDSCAAFTTVPAPWPGGDVGVPRLLRSAEGVDVVLEQSSRSGAVAYLWRVAGVAP